MLNIWFGKLVHLLWQCDTGQIFNDVNGQRLKNNITIWSHCTWGPFPEMDGCTINRLTIQSQRTEIPFFSLSFSKSLNVCGRSDCCVNSNSNNAVVRKGRKWNNRMRQGESKLKRKKQLHQSFHQCTHPMLYLPTYIGRVSAFFSVDRHSSNKITHYIPASNYVSWHNHCNKSNSFPIILLSCILT